MFGWFKPSCPVDPAAKVWIEDRLQWLCEEFRDNALKGKPLILPTAEFFPDAFDGSKRDVLRMLDRVCQYMEVSPNLVALRRFKGGQNLWLVNNSGQYLPTAAGTYQEGENKFIIRVSSEELAEPMSLVGTLAHELAHVRLLGEGRIAMDAYDNELLTDLTVVVHGLGVFLANVPRNWDSSYSQWPGTTLKKPEYMTPPMFGYALAHIAWHRGEERPDWAKYLHPSARAELRHALRFLQQTGDSSFRPLRPRLGP
jgi:hypothetical protein